MCVVHFCVLFRCAVALWKSWVYKYSIGFQVIGLKLFCETLKNKKWNILVWYPSKMRRYLQRGPGRGDCRWRAFGCGWRGWLPGLFCVWVGGVLGGLAKSVGGHLCRGLFFVGLGAWGLRLYWGGRGGALAQVFSLSFVKFLRATFLQSASGRLLLKWPN